MKKNDKKNIYRSIRDESLSTAQLGGSLDSHLDCGYYLVEINNKDRLELGLPVDNCGNEHYLKAHLFVTDSGNEDELQKNRVIGQTLVLSQCDDGKTSIYSRSYSSIGDGYKWSLWSKAQQDVQVGQVTSLDGYIHSGTYSGVYVNGTHSENFVIEVIDNQSTAAAKGMTRSISQFKYALNVDGTFSYKTRTGVGNTTISWGEWVDLGAADTTDIQDNSITAQKLSIGVRDTIENAGQELTLPLKLTAYVEHSTPLPAGTVITDFGNYEGTIAFSTEIPYNNGNYLKVTKELLPYRLPTDVRSCRPSQDIDTIITYSTGVKGDAEALKKYKPSKMIYSITGYDRNARLDVSKYASTFAQGRILSQVCGDAIPTEIRIGGEEAEYSTATKVCVEDLPYTLPFDVKTLWLNTTTINNPVTLYTIAANSDEYRELTQEKNIDTLFSLSDKAKAFKSISIELSMTKGRYYDKNLVLTDGDSTKYCEVDISQYQGCLIRLKAKTRAIDATGLVTYCGFIDDEGNTIHSFCGRYSTTVMEDDTIVLPVPRAFTAQDINYNEVEFKGAAKLCISSYTNLECSLEVVTHCNDNRLRGKNIAVLGSSNAALYFNGECRTNKGWFLYHLAPLFGYNCSARSVGSTGWGDISRQFERCKQDIVTTDKDYFDVVYLAETTNDGIGNFIDDYNHYIQGFCKELLYSGNDSIDSGLNEYCKTAANSIKEILNNSPRARMYIPMQFFNSNDYVEGKGALYLGQELKYENNFLKALCDVFNIKKISYSNGSSYRVWKEGAWYVWQGQSNGNTSDIKSNQQVLDQGDGIHASKPRGGWDMFKVFFATLWNDMLCDSIIS